MNKKRRRKIIFFTFLASLIILILVLNVISSEGSDSSSTSEWLMFGRTLNRTSYDGQTFPVISGLNSANFSQGSGVLAGASPAVAMGYLYIYRDDGYLYQLNASNVSQQITKVYLNYAGPGGPPAIVNGYVYVGSYDHKLYQLNASSVSQKINNFTTQNIIDNSPAIANGYVYIADYSGYVYQLNASNISQQIANYSTGGGAALFLSSSPAIAYGYLYIGCEDKRVYQLNASNISQQIANYTTGGLIDSSPIAFNGSVYIGSNDKNIYQLNASNISQNLANFTMNTGVNLVSFATPVIANGYVYMNYYNGGIYQLNAINVSQQINYNSMAGMSFGSPITVANGYVYEGGSSGIFQLNASNISQQINVYNPGTGGSTTAVAIANGYAYFGTAASRLIVQVNANNMSLPNDFSLPNITIISPINGNSYNSINQLNYSASDNVGLASCWYSINGGATNSSPDSTCSTFTITATTGSNTWTVYAEDTSGNINSSSVTFTIGGSSGSSLSNGGGGSGGGIVIPNFCNASTKSFSTLANIPLTINVNSIGLTQLVITTNQAVTNALVTVSQIPSAQPVSVSGQLYQSFQILTYCVTDSQISNVSISFQVNNSWISSNNVDPANISLYRSTNGTWILLPTTLISQDSQNYNYTAISPGFSNYTILAQAIECNNGVTRCLLNDSQVCSSNIWILSQHCQLGCGKGRCITTTKEVVNVFQNILNNVEGFFNGLPGTFQLTVCGVAYSVLIVMIISGVVIVSTVLIRNVRSRRGIWKRK